MRVNVDDQALNEPRIKRMAKRLGRPHYEVLGRLVHVWMLCYSRRTAELSAVDIDIAADLDGFAVAMVAEEMGDDEETAIYVRGVTERIRFLEEQSRKGRRSGQARRTKANMRTSAQQMLNIGSTGVEHRFAFGSTGHRTYSPDQDQDQSPDQDQDQTQDQEGEGPDKSVPQPDQPELHRASNGEKGKAALRVLDGGGTQDPAGPRIVQQGANGEAKRPRRESPPPPQEALTLAHLLLGMISTNNPSSRMAKAPERTREDTANRWAQTIDKLNRLDKFSWGEIQGMIMWCQRDAFWRTVILGADNLRDKWDKMAAQRQSKGKGQPSAFDVLDDWAKEQTT